MSALAVVALPWLAAPLQVAPPAEGAAVEARLETEARAVVVGEPIELLAVRAWRVGLEPEPFGVRSLAPLAVVELGVERRERDGRVVEERRLRAHALEEGELVLDRFGLAARDPASGASFVARAAPLALAVSSALPADDDGAIEVPFAPAGPRRSAGAVVAAVLAALLAAGATGLVRARRRARASDGESHGAAPLERSSPQELLARAAELEHGAAGALDAAGDDRWHGALWDLVRDAAACASGGSRPRGTPEETAAALGEAAGAQVRELGRACDLVRFAVRPSAPQERVARARSAREFVEGILGVAPRERA